MKKLYKNLTDCVLKANLYGRGYVEIPQGTSEIDEVIVRAFQAMTPVKLFEEVVTMEEEFIPKSLEEMTNKDLRALCIERNIDCTDKDTKTVLISKLRGE